MLVPVPPGRYSGCMQHLVQFGAGNIGRSFIGALFAQAGWKVTFVDVDERVVHELARRGGYPVVVKHPDGRDERREVSGVTAINGRDGGAVTTAVRSADLMATSVGKQALPHVLRAIAEGLRAREAPLDLILAENLRDGAAFARSVLLAALTNRPDLVETVGLVETSIGKMVPLMSEADRSADPLQVFAEPYNTLILDRHGFLGPIPDVAGVQLVDTIAAYVDRKLFIHNMGHAAAAYLGFRANPHATLLPDALEPVRDVVRAAMLQAAAALASAYPQDLTLPDLHAHVDDLLFRFGNRALGDTVYRVGRDLPRKLHKSDRMVGALLLAAAHTMPSDRIVEATEAALSFDGRDESGRPYEPDAVFRAEVLSRGMDAVISETCGLDATVPEERRVADLLRRAAASSHA